jgi:hypothetical protein
LSLTGAEVPRRLHVSKATVNNLRREQRHRTATHDASEQYPPAGRASLTFELRSRLMVARRRRLQRQTARQSARRGT